MHSRKFHYGGKRPTKRAKPGPKPKPAISLMVRYERLIKKE